MLTPGIKPRFAMIQSGNQNYVQKKKLRAADESYDGVALTFRTCPAAKSFLFQLGDGGNIELRGIFRDLVRQCFIHGAPAIYRATFVHGIRKDGRVLSLRITLDWRRWFALELRRQHGYTMISTLPQPESGASSFPLPSPSVLSWLSSKEKLSTR